MVIRSLEEEYVKLLRDYLNGPGEDQLYVAQQMGKWLLARNISPEELTDMHGRALEKLGDVPEFVRASFSILTEVMIEYGNEHRSVHSWRSRHQQLEAEMAVAQAMQQTLLPGEIPAYPGLEIGLVSIAAKQMSGDYYDFICQDEERFCLSVADITGKGISAAMCMSMLKYAIDSLREMPLGPDEMLHHLNRIVGRNIDPSMFVTMLYGAYDTRLHSFRYAVAGHEPGFLYRASEKKFADLEGQGSALGLCPSSEYEVREVRLEPGDVLILLTDGVTECKKNRYYLQRDELILHMQAEVGVHAQKMANALYNRLLTLSQFELLDDYTMIVLRRT
ncbi:MULTISPECIES: PP2C family protein-serine/threonine phosphatase [Brevibacillus]|jgi:sigma-B regulation protein RsbU (phosphoserine phosphatase)|uniref:Phosphoserine phosphatase RsbU n=1 Tax=Brevibacillus parabrevis TaxID=54914 RepID=A0A4Y3PMK9_BREPA|nr:MULTISPECIES: PP2C family protein-serine/threonine phosphatase [Brevibacillus]MBU8715661.1 PP2C family protein-serine/threonine phosphatase [Brevibacillus parabrevis]MDH6353611.1 sigma-B regulation protein RsbU (phosphoserine phosphatase) [Brevibacillus sp. 1238]MDR5001760.1 PP2C family protein-serine/threonine phosphatase [Brevibacillus parabrevis]MED2258040.1 PP2C family protein-serine/threonine phosphatase [Brevibacillus parabrevis]NRQ56865.1 PP2C family protein-serine/threonine phosphat